MEKEKESSWTKYGGIYIITIMILSFIFGSIFGGWWQVVTNTVIGIGCLLALTFKYQTSNRFYKILRFVVLNVIGIANLLSAYSQAYLLLN